ncbi:hypothetical protein ABT160_09265 [Streptomyces sp. NPDC001941]|uniref:hypothetical protein n=1 Tax=Streptomyces sp. NPDC001941 TaxID=3154659 RepID=UPI003320CD63
MSVTLVEQRYRSVLRVLPAYYRAEREDEMVEAFLHGVPEDVRDEARPSTGEVVSVLALAVRTRLGGAGAPARYAVLGEAVRLFALLGVLLQAATVLSQRALSLAWFSGAATLDRQVALGAFGGGFVSAALQVLAWALPFAWAGAYLALVRDRRRAAARLSAVAALPTLLTLGYQLFSPSYTGPVSDLAVVTALVCWLTVAAVACGFHEDAASTPLPLVPPGLALMGLCVLSGAAGALLPLSLEAYGVSGAAVIAVGAGALVVRVLRSGSSSAALPLALAALGASVLAVWATVLPVASQPGLPAAVAVGWPAETAVLSLLVLALAFTGVRDARRTLASVRRQRGGGVEGKIADR